MRCDAMRRDARRDGAPACPLADPLPPRPAPATRSLSLSLSLSRARVRALTPSFFILRKRSNWGSAASAACWSRCEAAGAAAAAEEEEEASAVSAAAAASNWEFIL